MGQYNVSEMESIFNVEESVMRLCLIYRIIYDLDYGRRLNEIPAHDDAVSCLSYINEGGILISGSWDCSVK